MRMEEEGITSDSLVYLAFMSFIGEEVMETAWRVKNFVEKHLWIIYLFWSYTTKEIEKMTLVIAAVLFL